MTSSAIRLPRRRFLKLKGNAVELAVGLLVVSLLQSQSAQAETLTGAPVEPAPVAGLPETLRGIDPDAIRTLSIDELKALLDAKTLAALGLDAGFLQLLDTDASAAIHRLEAAFREKIKAAAASQSKIAAAGDHHDTHADADAREGADAHHDAGLTGLSPLLLLAGLAVVGGGIALAGGGGDDDDRDQVANFAPTAAGDTVSTSEDTPVTFDVRGNDSDRDGGTLSVSQINGVAITPTTPVTITGGQVSLGADGRLTFTPAANFNGTPSFTYTLSDGQGGTATATVALSVAAVNDVPVAVADSFTTAEDTAVTIAVRGNDTDVDGNALTVTQVNGTAITATAPVAIAGGTVSLAANGDLVFTPAANFNGTPSFTYTVSDGQGGTATATVTGRVTAVNDAPVAVADSFTTAEDTAVTIAVRGNDTDADGDTLTVTQVNGAAITATSPVAVNGGVVSLAANGSLLFTPTANFNGTPSFTYTVTDGQGGTSTATVSGTVTAVNDAPVNTVPTVVGAIAQGVAVAIPGLSVSDVDGGTTIFTTTLSVRGGTLVAGTVPGGAGIAGNGTASLTLTGTLAEVNASLAAIGYTSAAGFVGAETLTMVTSDGQSTDTDTLALNVARVTQGVVIDGYVAGARIFFDANGNGQYDEGEVVATTDAQGRFVLVGDPVGTMIALGGVNTDTGLPNTIALKAPAGSTAVTPLTTLVAELVEAGVDLATAQAQIARAFGLPEGIDLGAFDFLSPDADPAIGFAVQKIALQIATLMIQAQAAGVSSTAIGEQLAQMAKAGGAIDLSSPVQLGSLLMAAGASPEAAEAAAQKAVAINLAIAAATSPDALVDTVRDLGRPGADLPPVTVADTVTTAEDTPVTFDVRGNDADPEGGALLVTRINGTPIATGQTVAIAGGTITLGTDGQLTFTPAPDFNGAPAFAYTVADAAGNATNGAVALTVTAVNDVAVANADSFIVAQNGTVTIDVLANDTDADGDTLAVTAVNGTAIDAATPVAVAGGTVALDADGRLVFTPAPGYSGAPVFTYTVSDGQGGTATTTVSGTVTPPVTLNAAPVAADDRVVGAADRAIAFDPRDNDTDPDGDPLTVIAVDGRPIQPFGTVAVANGTVLMTSTGALVFTPNAGYAGSQVLAYTVSDGRGGTAQGNVALVIEPAAVEPGNTAPVAASDIGRFGLGVPAVIDVLANDTDADRDTLRITGINGRALAVGTPVQLANGTVSLGEDGRLVYAPAVGFLGTETFEYTVTDDRGGIATGTVTAGLAAGPVLDVAPDAVGLAAASADALVAAGITTLDVAGDVATLGEPQAQALIDAGLHFAEADTVTLTAEGTTLDTSLKGLQSLGVDAIRVAGGTAALTIAAGGTLDSLDAASLPRFDLAQPDASLDVTLTVDGGTLSPDFDLRDIASALGGAGIDHIGVAGDGAIALSLVQGLALTRNGMDIAPAADVTLVVDADQARAVAGDPALLTTLHVDHLDVAGDRVEIADSMAERLVAAGVDFVAGDDVTVTAQGTSLGTTLKGLQSLHVDAVKVAPGVTALSLAAGGSLSGISAADLPRFDVAQSDDALDVTLTVEGGTVDPSLDLGGLAGELAAVGIDHIGIAGELSLGLAQAQGLADAGLDFTAASDITLGVDAAQVAALAADPSLLAAVGVDHLDATGAVTLSDAGAQALVGAGVDFVESDTVTVAAEGTTLGTSLKGLQSLHVDTVRVAAGLGALTIAAGGALDAVSAADLPTFDVPDVTLTVDAGMLDTGFDMGVLAPSLAGVGIDHIGVAGDAGSSLGLSLDQAFGVSVFGLDFTPASDVTVHLGVGELAALATPADAALLGRINVDTLDVTENAASISDDQAAGLVAAGLHFADGNDITVAAEGTQMSTSLRGLHDLKVDAVAVGAAVSALTVDAGDLSGISASDLPQFDAYATDDALDVTLRVDGAGLGDLARLAQGLADAGIDHVVTNVDLSTLDPAQTQALADMTRVFGIDVAYQDFSTAPVLPVTPEAGQAATAHAETMARLADGYEGPDDDGVGGTYRIADGAHHALAESGLLRAYTADTLVIDGTGSSDKLLASLKDIADMGVDEVRLADTGDAPVYVSLGLDGEGSAEIAALLRSLDGGAGPEPIFQGADRVALVMDADTAHALAQVDGAAEQLKAIGFTEIDVLADSTGQGAPAFGDAGLDVKLIGQDDELYRHLNDHR